MTDGMRGMVRGMGPGENGALVVLGTKAPRLLGDDCGCRRWKDGATWYLEPCERHAREILDNPEVVW